MTITTHYFFLVVDDSLDFDPGPGLPNFHRLRLSNFKLDIPKNSGAFLSQPIIIDLIEKTRGSNPAAVIPFKSLSPTRATLSKT